MCERHESLLDSRHHLWLVEPDHEQARLVEQVDRSTYQGRTLTGRPVLGNGASNSRPEATARHALDLGVELTKLLLSISNRSVGGRLVSLQSLPGGLVLHAGAVECARVAH